MTSYQSINITSINDEDITSKDSNSSKWSLCKLILGPIIGIVLLLGLVYYLNNGHVLGFQNDIVSVSNEADIDSDCECSPYAKYCCSASNTGKAQCFSEKVQFRSKCSSLHDEISCGIEDSCEWFDIQSEIKSNCECSPYAKYCCSATDKLDKVESDCECSPYAKYCCSESNTGEAQCFSKKLDYDNKCSSISDASLCGIESKCQWFDVKTEINSNCECSPYAKYCCSVSNKGETQCFSEQLEHRSRCSAKSDVLSCAMEANCQWFDIEAEINSDCECSPYAKYCC